MIFLAFGVKIVPQSQNYLVERLGRYNRTLDAGLQIIIPILEAIRHKVDVLERQLPTNRISAITLDNVTIELRLAILYRIVEAEKAIYRIYDLDQAIQTTVTGVVRSVIGRTELDGVQSNRQELSESIEAELRGVTQEWGIVLSRVEIVDVEVDDETKKAMQLQLNAERTRRFLVREAEGKKEAAQLDADAQLYIAQKQAEARRTIADADAYAVRAVAGAIAEGGDSAVTFEVKKIQADALRSLGESGNSKLIFIPSEALETLSSAATKLISRG